MTSNTAPLKLPGSMKLSRLAAPLLLMLILAMMILPLPPFLLDLLFTFNISLAIIVLLVSLYTLNPLEFSVFPTVLLLTTMLRLSLNVASTRVVLMHGHTGPGAAGRVIEAFGHFLIGGNYTVGLVVFIILIIINFVVITKGAGRIAEVSARFTLDAMPGKQMAIDADLNAGLIGEEDARRRRTQIAQEADFYGSMDGASKFVRGDAVAGILIVVINIIGGLVVGVVQHQLPLTDALSNYTLLAIGDGLVAQIPALVISIAAGLMVSRVATDEDIGQQLQGQLVNRPQILGLAAGVMGMLGVIPGMPNLVFLLFAGTLGAAAYSLKQKAAAAAVPAMQVATAAPVETQEVGWGDIAPVDVLSLEVGYRLIPLVDQTQDGELLRRIRGIRKKFVQEIGFLVAPVHIRDNLELKLNAYRITLKGVELSKGEVHVGHYLAINSGNVTGHLPGINTQDPTFGLPATWIEANLRDQAQAQGYTVVDASTVIATHLSSLVYDHTADLLGREEVHQLLEHLKQLFPKLVEDLVPKVLSVATFHKVLQQLLAEGVPIRDMRTILDALAEHAGQLQDADDLMAAVRIALGRSIVQQIFGAVNELQVMVLEPGLENLLAQAVQGQGRAANLEPGLVDNLARQTAEAVQRQEQLGLPPVLLAPPPLRALLARFLRRVAPQLHVLSQAEVPDEKTIKVSVILGNPT